MIPVIDVADLSDGSLITAGDINGDGYDDRLVGAPYADPDGRSHGGTTSSSVRKATAQPVKSTIP